MKRKILSILAAIAVLSTNTAFATEIVNLTPQRISPSGYEPIGEFEVDFKHSKDYIWGDTEIYNSYTEANLPASYDAVAEGLVTPAKNQGQYGSCWAFSTISVAETSMIKKGYADVAKVDYSERHIGYFAHNKNSFTGDGSTYHSSAYGYYGGGNPVRAAMFLSCWQGLELEENYPYAPYGDMANLPESVRYSSHAHLQDYLMLSPSQVKEAILTYGSVSAAYYEDGIYHTNANSYYQNDYTNDQENHAVTIVGWDDNYALSNFDELEEKPQNPGAWKIKNSWGDGRHDCGYFWLSYEDTSIGDYLAVNVEPASNYHINHHYDGADYTTYMSVEKSANIFTADTPQVIKAVGFMTYDGNRNTVNPVNYTAEVYVLDQNHTSPEDGTKMSTVSGTFEHDGHHTVPLETPVALDAGESFSVVMTLKYPTNKNSYHAFEGTSYASSNAGESFYYYNSRWQPSGNYNNAKIKAYATVENVKVDFDTNGGNDIASITLPKHSLLDIPSEPEKSGAYFAGWYKDEALATEWDFETDTVLEDTTLYAKWSETPIAPESITVTGDTAVYVGKSLTLTAMISPYYATDKTVSWSSSSASATVSDGKVTGVSGGTATITARTSNGKTATLAITVCNPIGVINTATQSPVYRTTDTIPYRISEANAEYFAFYIELADGSLSYIPRIDNTKSEMIFAISGIDYTEGEYHFWVMAYDALGGVKRSATKTFWVSDSPMLIGISYPSKVTLGGYIGSGDSTIVLAYYNAGQLAKVETVTEGIFDNLKDISYDYSYSELKVMWWDSLSGMTPVTDTISFTEYTGRIFNTH